MVWRAAAEGQGDPLPRTSLRARPGKEGCHVCPCVVQFPLACIQRGCFMPYKLKVNGRTSTVDVPPDMPLLWVLRDVLDIKGPKYGCGIGQCGACTVHVKGVPSRSCLVPVSTAVGSEITTIEGLSP